MDTKTMIREIENVAEKHKNDRKFTGQTVITDMCNDIIPKLEKLAEYETAEKGGRLVMLPSKQVWESQGDIVYYIYDYEITECVNCGISICADGKAWIGLVADEDIFPYREPIAEFDTDPTDWCKKTTDVLALEWGKTVFLTREEAEKALREMEEKQGE